MHKYLNHINDTFYIDQELQVGGISDSREFSYEPKVNHTVYNVPSEFSLQKNNNPSRLHS